MPRYLVSLAVGPVQEFIAAARRTRDLWYGSFLLSEVSKATALNLHQHGADLIFPAPEHPDMDLAKNSSLNVANKIMAEVETDNPGALLESAKQAAQTRWQELANKALEEISQKSRKDLQLEFPIRSIRQDLWNDQADDLLELFAAWTPLNGDYKTARNRVEALLAARKNTRHFRQPGLPDLAYGVPKSSLDGKRESVLPGEKELPKWVKSKLGLNAGEQLDCPGLVKRLGGDENRTQRFTSIPRIALDPWLRKIEPEGGLLSGLSLFLEPLVKHGLVTREQGNEGIYANLPYDGQMLYPFRLEAELKALEKLEKQASTSDQERLEILQAKPALRRLREQMQPVWRDRGQPCPYVAVLLADGDRMGFMLDKLSDADHHRLASQALAKFAQNVPRIVRAHRGHCIYAGGDDVLALVPLDHVIACARKLHDDFATRLNLDFSDIKPTLSVGIAIGHLLEPMGGLLDLARKAEKLAKGTEDQRDGLGIILEPRSGAPIQMSDQWLNTPDKRLEDWIAAFSNEEIPSKAPYELRELARELDWAEPPLIQKEMRRILGRKRAESGNRPLDPEQIDQLVGAVKASQGGDGLSLRNLVDELLIARRLSQAV
jgi:CRISPR-associated protein Cmr2